MDQPDALVTRSVVATAIACEGGLALLAVILGWPLERGPLAQIEWTATGLADGLAAAVPLLVGLVLITRFPIGPFKALEDIANRLIVPLFAACSWWQLLLISALAGVGEEALFRGVFQAGIQQFSGSPWWGLLVASVLFGAAHPITPTYAVVAGLIGAYLGGWWLATGNLLVPIVTHAAYDFAALIYLVRRSRKGFDGGGDRSDSAKSAEQNGTVLLGPPNDAGIA